MPSSFRGRIVQSRSLISTGLLSAQKTGQNVQECGEAQRRKSVRQGRQPIRGICTLTYAEEGRRHSTLRVLRCTSVRCDWLKEARFSRTVDFVRLGRAQGVGGLISLLLQTGGVFETGNSSVQTVVQLPAMFFKHCILQMRALVRDSRTREDRAGELLMIKQLSVQTSGQLGVHRTTRFIQTRIQFI